MAIIDLSSIPSALFEVPAMPRNTFRLGTHDTLHYVALFDSALVKVVPPSGIRPFGQTNHGVAELSEGDLEFEIYMPVIDGEVPTAYLDAARSMLSQIVQMDDAARAIPSDFDHDERLACIMMHDVHGVNLRYFATTVNTEWDVRFTLGADGVWHCGGIVPPKQYHPPQ
jgi:hypothetical protein